MEPELDTLASFDALIGHETQSSADATLVDQSGVYAHSQCDDVETLMYTRGFDYFRRPLLPTPSGVSSTRRRTVFMALVNCYTFFVNSNGII